MRADPPRALGALSATLGEFKFEVPPSATLGEIKFEVPPSATLGEFKLERAAERYV